MFHYKIEDIAFIFFSVWPVFRAIIYTGKIGVIFILQRIFPYFKSIFSFVLSNTIIILLNSLPKYTKIPPDEWLLILQLCLKTELLKSPFRWFFSLIFSLCSLNSNGNRILHLLISPSERPFMFQNPIFSQDFFCFWYWNFNTSWCFT